MNAEVRERLRVSSAKSLFTNGSKTLVDEISRSPYNVASLNK